MEFEIKDTEEKIMCRICGVATKNIRLFWYIKIKIMKPAYELIEEYNYLSEEDKKEF